MIIIMRTFQSINCYISKMYLLKNNSPFDCIVVCQKCEPGLLLAPGSGEPAGEPGLLLAPGSGMCMKPTAATPAPPQP